MGGLQVLEETYGGQGFKVLGFYSNDFGSQGGSSDDIEGCNDDYGVTFEQFEIAPVSGANARPVFAWLFSHPNPGPKPDPLEPTWNFHKYLIARDGTFVGAFDRFSYPGEDPQATEWTTHELVLAIEAELAK